MMKQSYDSYKPSGIDWIGEIPSHWDISKIKFEGEIRGRIGFRGYTVSDLVEEGEGAYTIGGKHISKNVLDLSEPEYISWEKYYESPEIMVHKGDIVIAQRGTLKRCALIDSNISEATINPSLVLLTNIKINQKYLHYYLCSNATTEYIDYLNTATAVPMISQNQIENIRIALPPIAEQEGIAAWLDEKCGEIDAAIAKVDREIELIDELKLSEISRVVTRGLNHNAPLRPSGIDWIGEIPEHWKCIPVKYFFYLKGRIGWLGLKADEFKTVGPHLVTGTDFENGRVNWDKCYRITEERFNEAPEIHVKKGDLLITKDGTVGKLAYIEDMPDKVSLNSHLLIIRPLQDFISNKYVFWLCLSRIFKDYSGLIQDGSIMASLSQEDISNFRILLPSLSEQREIADYLDKKCAEIDELKAQLKKKRDTLLELRQSMISEVVTGKRKVV